MSPAARLKAGIAIVDAKPELVAEIRSKTEALEREWVKAATAKGVDGAKGLADFRAELAKVAAEKWPAGSSGTQPGPTMWPGRKTVAGRPVDSA